MERSLTTFIVVVAVRFESGRRARVSLSDHHPNLQVKAANSLAIDGNFGHGAKLRI